MKVDGSCLSIVSKKSSVLHWHQKGVVESEWQESVVCHDVWVFSGSSGSKEIYSVICSLTLVCYACLISSMI